MIRQWLLWWWAKKNVPAEFSFPQALRDAKRVLLLMPSSVEALREVEVFLSRLPKVFPRAEVTLLYPPKSMIARFYKPYGFTTIVPGRGDVGLFGMPSSKIMGALTEKRFDVLISLNRQPSVFFAAISISSKAPVRLGLPDGMGEPFINVELRHGRENADIKTEFILFVDMLRKLAAVPAGPEESEPGRMAQPRLPL
ncbi:MAG: hypothetical protein AB1752_11490 [Candidatus Zixiibacteriota bacterium]